MQVTLPSGLKGEARALTGAEAKILSGRRPKGEDTVLEIVKRCFVPEESTFYAPSFDWTDVLLADFNVIILAVRIATYGSEFEFQVRCPACEKKFGWELDLNGGVDIYAIPDESMDVVKSGSLFECPLKTNDGLKSVHFRLGKVSDRRRLMKNAEKHGEDLNVAMATRVEKIDDLESPSPSKAFEAKIKFFESLGISEHSKLSEYMESLDGGIDTAVPVECVHCGEETNVELPFDGRDFWSPSQKQTQKKERKKIELF